MSGSLFVGAFLVVAPAYPMSRAELAEHCNRLGVYRRRVTERIVKYWERQGLIERHPAYRHPVRYTQESIKAFI